MKELHYKLFFIGEFNLDRLFPILRSFLRCRKTLAKGLSGGGLFHII
jgi:hypothetical protein